MSQTGQLCLLAGALALCLVKAAASPVAGIWEGQEDGRKAVTLTVRETDGILGGNIIFYIVHDDGTGALDGSALPHQALVGTTWDGRTLRFSIELNDGATMAFELNTTAAGSGDLKVLTGPNSGHITHVSRQKER